MPDILLSVRRIDRFSVVIGPTGIMSIVAILPPTYGSLGDIVLRKYGPINPIAPNVSFLPRAICGSETGKRRKMAVCKVSQTPQERGAWFRSTSPKNSPCRHPANKISLVRGDRYSFTLSERQGARTET